MATLGLTAMQWVQLGSVAVSGATAVAASNKNAGYAEATRESAERLANDREAAAQREAIEARRQARVAQSRALAVAGRGDDKTVLDVMGGIGRIGESAALAALFEGKSSANYVRSQADQNVRQARSERTQAGISAIGSTALTFADVYGDRKVPDATSEYGPFASGYKFPSKIGGR